MLIERIIERGDDLPNPLSVTVEKPGAHSGNTGTAPAVNPVGKRCNGSPKGPERFCQGGTTVFAMIVMFMTIVYLFKRRTCN